jgi:hypothetical protein
MDETEKGGKRMYLPKARDPILQGEDPAAEVGYLILCYPYTCIEEIRQKDHPK